MPPTARKAAPQERQEAPGRAKPLYVVAGAADLVAERLRRPRAALGRKVGRHYDQLAKRGQQVVTWIRRQKTVQRLVEEMDETVHRARAVREAAMPAAGRAPQTPEGTHPPAADAARRIGVE
jgi:hypothetical protein